MTIAGQPSVAELRDLVASHDYELAQLAQAYADFAPNWVKQDPTAFVNWTNDWDAMNKRYQAARSMAENSFTAAKLSPIPDKDLPANAPWTAILRALKKIDGVVSPGDLQDLYTRFTAAGAKAVDFSKMPQPTPGNDQDMNLLTALNQVPAILGGGNSSGFFGLPSWVGWGLAGLAGTAALVMGGEVLAVVAPLAALLPHRRKARR